MTLLLDQWLWRQEFWFPPGVTWKDLEIKESVRYPVPRDLLVTIPVALGLIILRHTFERWVALPLSRQLGLKSRVRVEVSPIPKFEAFYKKMSHRPSQSALVSLAKQCDFSQRQTEMWFHHRRNQDKPTNMKRFCEACWRFVFYLIAFLAGLASLINKPWFWDQKECWRGFPQQTLLEAQYWYYMTELGFYLSLLLRISVDIRRKDFRQQVIHHVTTVFLIGLSYCGNYVRIGTLIMLVHDSSDFLLECAKMCNYLRWRRTCDTLFVIFAVVFLVTRLVIFPARIIYTTIFGIKEFFEPFFAYYLLNLLLLVLQMLHVFWSWLILRAFYRFILLGKVERDERSDEESVDEGDDGVKEVEESICEGRHCTLKYNPAPLVNDCVLENFTNHRSSSAGTVLKTR